MRCLIVHGDGAKTVGYETQYVLFAASDEQDVAANGQLLEAKVSTRTKSVPLIRTKSVPLGSKILDVI